MRTIQVSKRSRPLNELLEKARTENLVIRSADGDEFILAEIDDFDREIQLARENKDLMPFLQRQTREEATVSLDEARDPLGIPGK